MLRSTKLQKKRVKEKLQEAIEKYGVIFDPDDLRNIT